MADTGVVLTEIRKSFGNLEVIHGIDLTITEGSFVVFVGPSGCGKSTLLRMIAGLEDVTDGEIEIKGRNVTDLDPSDRGIAMVFQSYALYPHMSVRENLAFGLKMARTQASEIEIRVKAASAILKIDHLLERRPGQLSGGQRQRVAIGRAIVRKPEVFLFDEPLSNLDAELRVSMRIEIARLHRELGNTMIYVTHDQTEAMTLADKIVVLRDGRIEQAGTPHEIYERPNNVFVAGFIGSPRMNLLPARVVGQGTVAMGEAGQEVELGRETALTTGTSVTLGIRPEHIALAGEGEAGLAMTVDLVERLGGESYLYGSAPGLPQITVRLDGQTSHGRGDHVALRFQPAHLHLFDAAGKALRPDRA
jgi:ABC-type sugar transport system ATPase subunit